MLIFNSLRALLHFWEFGGFMLLIPAVFLAAALMQFLLFRRQKRPWLPAAVCGGILLLVNTLASIAIMAMGRNGLGIAFVGMAAEMFLLSAILGLSAGLLVSLLMKQKAF